MQASDIPAKMPTPWANGAGPSYVRDVPIPSQVSTDPSQASFTDGFPPNTFEPIASGGTGPYGQDMNGLLRAATRWLRWTQAGGPIRYDSAFATAVGGYPSGAVVMSSATPGLYWLCTADNNTTNPDSGGSANWTALQPHGAAGGDLSGTYPNPTVKPGAGHYPGEMFWFGGNAAPTGSLLCDGSSYATSAYPNLFAAIGYNWGGSGANFNVPPGDIFLRAWTSSGSAVGTAKPASVGTHRHLGGVSVTTGSPLPFNYGGSALDTPGSASSTAHTDSNTPQRQQWTSATIYDASNNPAASTDNYPKHGVALLCIKT